MIDYLILGATGYVGQEFVKQLYNKNIITISRKDVDYTKFNVLVSILKDIKPRFLINCAGYTGKPNVDECERNKSKSIISNIVLIECIANACEITNTPWGHISSGCIYSGGKILSNGSKIIYNNLMEAREIWDNNRDILFGYDENDGSNFTFESEIHSFYSGTKDVAEQLLKNRNNLYIWRLRIPFDSTKSPRNYLMKLLTYDKVYNNIN